MRELFGPRERQRIIMALSRGPGRWEGRRWGFHIRFVNLRNNPQPWAEGANQRVLPFAKSRNIGVEYCVGRKWVRKVCETGFEAVEFVRVELLHLIAREGRKAS